MTPERIIQFLFIIGFIAAASIAAGKVFDMLFAAIRKKVRQLRALRRVVNAASAWAQAERELRNFNDRQALARRLDSYFARSLYEVVRDGLEAEEAQRVVVTFADATEEELLRAVEAARAEGLNLSR